MKRFTILIGVAVLHGARREVGLDADNRFDAGVGTGAVKVNHAEHRAMIGNRQRIHAEVFGTMDELVNTAETVQQRVFRVDVKMHKIV